MRVMLLTAMNIHQMLQPTITPVALAGALDELPDVERVNAVVDLRRKELAALFEAAAGNRPLALTDLVPATVPPLTAVIHAGKNSLPMFTRFEKRFCRPPGGDELWGFNEQDLRAITGPGYFVVHQEDQQLIVDYRRLPPEAPPGWPRIIPNSARLSRFIYNGTIDVLRRVSEGVVIGRAYRAGKPMDAWFALVRREVRASA
jgi:hypothetical protein